MHNRNTLIIIGVCWLLITMLGGCGKMFQWTFKEDIPQTELKRMGFSLDRYRQSEVLLTADDKAKIQQILGHPLRYYPKGFGFYNEIRHGEIGDIVPLKLETPYGRLIILARIKWYSIDKIIVSENVSKDGKPLVNEFFLSQFIGGTVSSSYKVATPPTVSSYRPEFHPAYQRRACHVSGDCGPPPGSNGY